MLTAFSMRTALTGAAALVAAAVLTAQSTQPPVVKPPTTLPPSVSKPPQKPPVTSTTKPIASGEIAGRIVDTDARAIATATVWLVGAAGLTTAISDSRGRFAFTNVASGEYVVLARKHGFYDGAFGRRRVGGTALPVSIVPSQSLSDMQIELFRSGVITGSVFDEANEPVIGARVVVTRRFFGGLGWQYVRAGSVLTDDQGTYRLYGLEPGEYVISTPTTQVNVAVPDLKIIAPQLPHTESDTQAYPSLFYSATRHSLLAQPVRVGSGEVRHAVNFQWAPVPARRVEGRLTGPQIMRRSQLVRLVPIDADEMMFGEAAATMTDDEGAFAFERVPAGEYRIEAGGTFGPPRLVELTPLEPTEERPTLFFGRLDINVIDEDLKDLTIGMQTGYPLTARVTGGLPERMSVVVVPARPGLSRPTSVAAVKGSFSTVPLVPGDYFIRVAGLSPGWYVRSITAGGENLLDKPAKFGTVSDPSVTIELTTRPTVISGAVRDAGMRAAAGAAIIVMPADASSWNPNRSRQLRASMNGQYSVTGLPAGDYLIVAIDDAAAEGVQNDGTLAALRTLATRVSVRDEESKTLQLRLSTLRR